MADTEELPVRYCHRCKTYDDHPRTTVAVDAARPDLDRLYHIDCVPAEHVTPELQPLLDARNDGQRGDDLRSAAVEYAASIEEAPADDYPED